MGCAGKQDLAKKSGQKLGCSPSVLFAKEKAGSMCGEGDPAGHADGFRNVRVTSLFHCEAGMMALLIIWFGSAERDLAGGSAGGPARVASLSPAKREAKREATKAWQAWPGNQTSSRCLVRSLVCLVRGGGTRPAPMVQGGARWSFGRAKVIVHSAAVRIQCRPRAPSPGTSPEKSE